VRKDPVVLNIPVVFPRTDLLLLPQHPRCLPPPIPTLEAICHPFGHLLALSSASERSFVSIFPLPQSQPLGSSKTRAELFLPAQLCICSGTTVTSDQPLPPQSKSQGWFLTAIFHSPFPDLEHVCPFAFPRCHFASSHWSLCPLDLCSRVLSPRLCPSTGLLLGFALPSISCQGS